MQQRTLTTAALLILLILLVRDVETLTEGGAAKEEALAAFRAHPSFSRSTVECLLSSSGHPTLPNGLLSITLHHDTAPHAAGAFQERVAAGFYDGCFIFRVLRGFVAQWGFNPRFQEGKKVSEKTKWRRPLLDTAGGGAHQRLSHTRGAISFAGSSAVQVFVNLGDNRRLDKEGGRPFGVLSSASVALLDALDTTHKDGDGQIGAIKAGDASVAEKFPNMSRISRCSVVAAGGTGAGAEEQEHEQGAAAGS